MRTLLFRELAGKPDFSPELVFERPPRKKDTAKKVGRSVGAIAAAIFSRQDSSSKAEWRKHWVEAELRDEGLVFAEYWRARLGTELEKGVALKTSGLPYVIDATLSSKDSIHRHEGFNDCYETTLVAHVIQPSGHTTSLKIDTRKTHYAEEDEGYVVDARQRSHTLVSPLGPDGSANGSGWGFYTHTEATQMYELAMTVMANLDSEYRNDRLQISPQTQ